MTTLPFLFDAAHGDFESESIRKHSVYRPPVPTLPSAHAKVSQTSLLYDSILAMANLELTAKTFYFSISALATEREGRYSCTQLLPQ